jgi:histidinol phosphatase-like enzyme
MKIRKNSFPDELTNIGIDFDGVIHKNSKGYYDGTIYDDPIPGSLEALKIISQKYDIIIFTAKAKKDRGTVNGKTGTEMVWDWLKKYNVDMYIKEVTSEKPRAVAYIDDKAIRFNNWDDVLEEVV